MIIFRVFATLSLSIKWIHCVILFNPHLQLLIYLFQSVCSWIQLIVQQFYYWIGRYFQYISQRQEKNRHMRLAYNFKHNMINYNLLGASVTVIVSDMLVSKEFIVLHYIFWQTTCIYIYEANSLSHCGKLHWTETWCH